MTDYQKHPNIFGSYTYQGKWGKIEIIGQVLAGKSNGAKGYIFIVGEI